MKPGKSHNEKARLAALRELDILDTPAEKQFDNITELAAYICETPIAMISLIDDDRQWIKSKSGVDLCSGPRDVSFCGHAILNGKAFMEIEDVRQDERFKNNPETKAKKDPVVFYAGYPLKDAQGHVLGTLCVIDHQPRKLTTRQKKAVKSLGHQVERLFELRLKNNELTISRADLERHNALLRNFAGAVSHDLKMPLSNIIMTIDILKGKYAEKLDSHALTYLNRLKQSAFGMSDYISNILAYYETENISSEDYSEKPFELKSFLESIIEMLNIESDCEINLPDNNLDLVCNRSGLEQIFLNLLGNSLKYNDKEKTVISINCEENKSFYEFSIADNGMGIPEGQQDKIFDLFSTAADEDRHGKKGYGIGLSTVQKLVHKLGGEIDVSSEVGKYTTFSFTIKKQKAQQQKTA